jgi:hypothetical protein
MPLFNRVITGSITVDATPEETYQAVSDPLIMATLAEEVYRARWLDDTTEATTGARFRGYNRNGFRRWTTTCTVTDADPGRRFAYRVVAPLLRIPVSRWQYDIGPGPDGHKSTVTETNHILAPLWFIPFALLITGMVNRPGANRAHIATTLERLKSHLAAAPAA